MNYAPVGHGIEDMSHDKAYESNETTDVLGYFRRISRPGSEVIAVAPIAIADLENDAFVRFVERANERNYRGSALYKWFVFVKDYKRIGTSFDVALPSAFRQLGEVVPQSWANDNNELNASVEVALIGERQHGTFDEDASGDKFIREISEPTDAETHFKPGTIDRKDFLMLYEHE